MKKRKKQLLPIYIAGHTLRAKNNIVDPVGTQSMYDLIEDMIYTMHRVKGVGIAAPQVGSNIRLAIALIDRQPVVLINPEVVEHSDEQVSLEESCLSCPNEAVRISRYYRVKVAYQNVKGVKKWLEVTGINAIIVQHELDHLDGKLITDYKDVSPAPELLQDIS